jgi:uncharacterized membrane protein YeiH
MWTLDAIGVPAFACIGVMNARRMCTAPVIQFVCGIGK